MGIQDSVHLVGPRPAEEMQVWMELSDALVSPRSEGDNTPLKIYSYMSSLKPIVATKRRTHTQVLNDSNAFLAEPVPEAFGKALHEALYDEALARGKSEAAKRLVESQYSYACFKERLLQAYDYISKRESSCIIGEKV